MHRLSKKTRSESMRQGTTDDKSGPFALLFRVPARQVEQRAQISFEFRVLPIIA